MIIIIDNYDSFIYNIARYVSELGYQHQIFRNDAISVESLEQLKPQAIIISPGPCAPLQAGICLSLVKKLGATTPILGICLGHQVIGQAYGGKIVQSQQPIHGKASMVSHNGESIFKNIENPMQVARYHSLAIEEETLPIELKVIARTQEGELMAIQHQQHPVIGVQFHPESVLTPNGKKLIENFLRTKAEE